MSLFYSVFILISLLPHVQSDGNADDDEKHKECDGDQDLVHQGVGSNTVVLLPNVDDIMAQGRFRICQYVG